MLRPFTADLVRVIKSEYTFISVVIVKEGGGEEEETIREP